MRSMMRSVFVLVFAVASGCSAETTDYHSSETGDRVAAAEAAAEAAEAATNAAVVAANEIPSTGGNAAALRQMGGDHLLRDFTSDLPEANFSRRAAPAEKRSPGAAERAMLAYEHEVDIRMDAERIPAKVQAIRKDCEASKFGACLVLEVSQSGGRYARGGITVRAEPGAIEPLIAAAGEGGDIGDRSTRAEDLAVAVRDNTMLQERLRKQHARLLEFQARKDLKVEDMIALSDQISRVEAQLESAEREGATHQRRIETQLLTIEFSPFAREEQSSEIASAFSDSGSVMAASTGAVIRVVSALIPVLLALAIAIWLLRRVWRWRRKAPPAA